MVFINVYCALCPATGWKDIHYLFWGEEGGWITKLTRGQKITST